MNTTLGTIKYEVERHRAIHEGGTKFYELLWIGSKTAGVSLRRWGKRAVIDHGAGAGQIQLETCSYREHLKHHQVKFHMGGYNVLAKAPLVLDMKGEYDSVRELDRDLRRIFGDTIASKVMETLENGLVVHDDDPPPLRGKEVTGVWTDEMAEMARDNLEAARAAQLQKEADEKAALQRERGEDFGSW